MPELACVNGEFCPLDQARVSVEDRGFQFADGVYEVVVFHGAHAVMLEAHLDRLARSSHAIHLDVNIEELQLSSIIKEGVRRAGFEATMVYVQLTRGTAPRNHTYPQSCRPTVVMTFKPKPVVPPEQRRRGISVMTLEDYRWAKCHIKSIALLPNVMARNEAIAEGFDDAVFLGPRGDVREASAANLFIIRKNRLITHPRDSAILHGITRQLVMTCAKQIDLPIEEHTSTRDDLYLADEVFLSSTTVDILPVVRVDTHVVADGCPGSWTEALYEQMKKELGIPQVTADRS